VPGVDNFRDRLQIVEPQTTLQAVCKGDDSSCLGVFNQAADFFFPEREKRQTLPNVAHACKQ